MAKNPAIRRRLMKIILLTSGLVLLLNCAVLFAYQYFAFKQAAVRNLTTLGEVIAANSTAALAFDNIEDANAILAALKAEPQIVAAAVYDKSGTLFAKYPHELTDNELPATVGADGYRQVSSNLIGFQPIAERNSKRLGTLYLQSNTRYVYEAIGVYGIVVALMTAVSLLVAYFISTRLQRQISQPVLLLAETATAISERRDYSVRASKMSDDEFGQ